MHVKLARRIAAFILNLCFPLSCVQLRIQEKLIYDDLDSNCDTNTNKAAPLNLTHVDRYLHGPVPGYSSTESTSEELLMTLNQLKRETTGWLTGNSIPRQLATSLVSPAAAVSALGELTPGGSLMKGFREESLGRKYIPLESFTLAD